MSAPNPSTHEPEPVWNLEVNGASNIILHVEMSLWRKKPIDTAYLRHMARRFDSYVAKLETGRRLAWHEHLAEERA